MYHLSMNAKITSEYAALVKNSSKPFSKTGLVDKEYVAVPEVSPLSLRLEIVADFRG